MVVTMKPAQSLDGVRDEGGEQVGEGVHVGVNHVGAFGLQLLNNVPLARFGGVDQSGVTIIVDIINVSGL